MAENEPKQGYPTPAETLDALRSLLAWATGPNKSGNPYCIEDVKKGLRVVNRAYLGTDAKYLDAMETAAVPGKSPAFDSGPAAVPPQFFAEVGRGPTSAQTRQRARVLWAFLGHMQAAGYTPHSVVCDDGEAKARTPLGTLELVECAKWRADLFFTFPEVPDLYRVRIEPNWVRVFKFTTGRRNPPGPFVAAVEAFDPIPHA